MTEIAIVGGARTAMAEYEGTPGHGAFASTSAVVLAAEASKEALKRARVSPDKIEHVVFGNAMQTGDDAIYGARHVGLRAGVPIEVPAFTVNRLCGSGMQSSIDGAHQILLGESRYVLVGGMENMSQAPHVIRGARRGFRLGQGKLEDLLMSSLMDPFCGLFMAQTAEKLAAQYGIDREAQDALAYRSHDLGTQAVQDGVFGSEIVPVEVKWQGERVAWVSDDHIKPDTSVEALGRLRPAFGKEGTVTAGNASGIVDGAAALVMTSVEEAQQEGLDVQGILRAWAVVGVPPDIMGIGPAPAIRAVVDKAGIGIDDVDLFEINEAFAAQYLAVEKDLELDREKVNVNGGAIALGHPLGATGARLILTLLREMGQRKVRYGITSACIGGGQGIALLWERP